MIMMTQQPAPDRRVALASAGFTNESSPDPDVVSRQLATIAAASHIFSGELSARAACEQALDMLKEQFGIVRGCVALFDPVGQRIRIDASSGLSDAARFACYKPGEGVVGRVIESGKITAGPVLDGSEDTVPDNAHTINVCLPLIIGGNTIGALSVDLSAKPIGNRDTEICCLSLIATMIAQAIKADYMAGKSRYARINEGRFLADKLRQTYDFSNIVGADASMQLVYRQIAQVAHANTTVLICGETGTGKEVIAHSIHYNSTRARKPFVKVNCAALSETLIESELFGYEKGALADAERTKKDRFELAGGGTLFLDEIGDMSLAAQAMLLRVLREKEFERLGGTSSVRPDMRLIAGTNKSLEKLMAEGIFREDLYYRLNVFTIVVPPLRDRRADLFLLADHFLRKFATEHRKDVRVISSGAMNILTAYHWPGNVRELANVLEHAVLVCDADVVHRHHLPIAFQTTELPGIAINRSLTDAVDAFEKNILVDALKAAQGNQSKAARLLQSTERIVSYKIRKHEIDSRHFR
jgi:Nif-specific regulatory protein